MNVIRYLVGGDRYLAVDASDHVPDRTAFASRVCDPETGVEPPTTEDGSPVESTAEPPPTGGWSMDRAGEESVRSPDRPAFDGGRAVSSSVGSATPAGRGAGLDADTGRGADPDAGTGAHPDAETGADAVLFLGPETEYDPPRVVLTVVEPDGDRTPFATGPVRAAARWLSERTDASRVMVDTQAGTAAVRVRDDGTATVESVGSGRADGRPAPDAGERPPRIEREFATEVRGAP
ncbi:MAG: hypothetical protein V5A23_02710 [Halobacteriales archaeon]